MPDKIEIDKDELRTAYINSRLSYNKGWEKPTNPEAVPEKQEFHPHWAESEAFFKVRSKRISDFDQISADNVEASVMCVLLKGEGGRSQIHVSFAGADEAEDIEDAKDKTKEGVASVKDESVSIGPEGATVNAKWNESLHEIWPEVEKSLVAAVDKMLVKTPDRNEFAIVLSGHSAGGSIATLAAYNLMNDEGLTEITASNGQKIKLNLEGVYTFGAARVSAENEENPEGDNKFVQDFDSKSAEQGVGVFNVKNPGDEVAAIQTGVDLWIGAPPKEGERTEDIGNARAAWLKISTGSVGGEDHPASEYYKDLRPYLKTGKGEKSFENHEPESKETAMVEPEVNSPDQSIQNQQEMSEAARTV